MQFPHLFSPFRIRRTEFRNRIFSTGHDTNLPEGGLPSPALIAYQEARAKGGAGLIIIQVVGVHETARYTDALLMGTDDLCIPKFRDLIGAIQAHGARAMVQLFHPGRELVGRPEGVAQAAYAPSCTPSERFRTVPRALSSDLIDEIIAGYGATAQRMAEAGADGVELVASHGYLPAQFLNSRVNCRTDRYGGSLENRARFMIDALAAIRRSVPSDFIVGLRFSGEEYDSAGLTEDETLATARLLKGKVDYFNVIAGTSAASAGAVHIAPPMTVRHAYLAPYAGKLKQSTGSAVFVAGRINQPQDAERIVAEGQADMCGMTRAMICDPEMAGKAQQGRTDDIRACIACNQACIGHFQLGLPISCIQHPETGRELTYGNKPRARRRRRVIVVGGGPAGLKAAACAAERGHHVTLCEREGRLGGQANLAQLVPGRAEFGGIVQNLSREAERAGVRIMKNTPVDAALIARESCDVLVLATGSRPRVPAIEGAELATNVVHAVDVLAGKARTGARVVVYDWLADWIGAGVAEKLAAEGAYVRIAVNGLAPAAAIQNYVRDVHLAALHKAGVEILPMMRLFGVDGSSAYFIHTAAQAPVVINDIDTVVLACPNEPNDELAGALRPLVGELHLIGDCLAPRTAEEAVFEGLKVAMAI